MKKKLKHSSAKRLYWKNVQRCWRAAHPERAREIRRAYWKRKRERERGAEHVGRNPGA